MKPESRRENARKVANWLLGGYLVLWLIAQVVFYFRYQRIDLPGIDFVWISIVLLVVLNQKRLIPTKKAKVDNPSTSSVHSDIPKE